MDSKPSISCILPIGYGDRYFQLALSCALNQTYEGTLEIIVLDNSDEPIESLLPADSRIKYFRCDRMPVGALRNLGTSYSSGKVCVTWDEDDWSSKDRVAEQVARLVASGKAVTGWHNINYFNASNGDCFKYFFAPGERHHPYACGTSQMYLKSYWESHKFNNYGVEDYYFQLEAMQNDQLDSCDADQLCVARAHDDSVCPISQYVGHPQFPQVDRSTLPNEFFADMERISTTEKEEQ